MNFSRVFEVKFGMLHLPGVTYRILGLLLILTGAFAVGFRDRIGKCMFAFTACLIVSTPFSVWPGGSVAMLTSSWVLALITFTATAGLIVSFPQYVQIVKTMAFGSLVLTGIALKMGSMQTGRLTLERGRFANPNELAQALLISLPIWWAIYSVSRSVFVKVMSVGSMMFLLYVVSKTGSRAAMIATAVFVAIMFLRASLAGKIKVLAGAAVLLAVAVLIIPADLRARYQTFFSADEEKASDENVDVGLLDSAAESADSRRQLLIESLILTAKHPLLGIGPDQFAVAENDYAQAQGKPKGQWLGTHNTFTQVSSECGIPAFLFYAAVLIFAFKYSYSLYRQTKLTPQWKEINTYALALNYSLIVFAVSGFFIHAAYSFYLPALSGLALALKRCAAPLLERETAPLQQTGRSQTPSRTYPLARRPIYPRFEIIP